MDNKKNRDKAKELLDSNSDILKNWLGRAQEVRRMEPYVRQAYDIILWQKDSLSVVPEDAPDIDSDMLLGLENTVNIIQTRLPNITVPENVSSISATTITGSSDTFDYLNRIVINIAPEKQKPVYTQINFYKQIHEKQNRLSDVKKLLVKLDNELNNELDIAHKEIQHFKNDTSNIVAPATSLRNVLQHFKGKLLLKARNTQKETTNWAVMTSRLVITGSCSPEKYTLEEQGRKNSQLYDKLSKILKGNLSATSLEIENLFIEVVDHFYAVLTLISI